MSYDYDLFVIGAGSGGLASSKRAASYGAKVAIAEYDLVGGNLCNSGLCSQKIDGLCLAIFLYVPICSGLRMGRS